jgi:hypothetical protein
VAFSPLSAGPFHRAGQFGDRSYPGNLGGKPNTLIFPIPATAKLELSISTSPHPSLQLTIRSQPPGNAPKKSALQACFVSFACPYFHTNLG